MVLIESGGLPPGRDFTDLTRLNFVAILTVLQELVKDDLAGQDPAVYDNLLRNESDSWTDVAIRPDALRRTQAKWTWKRGPQIHDARNDRNQGGRYSPITDCDNNPKTGILLYSDCPLKLRPSGSGVPTAPCMTLFQPKQSAH